MARSLLLSVAVAACALLVVTDFADAGCRKRRHRGGCGGGYSQGCGGGYADNGCGGYSGGCGGGYGGCGGGYDVGGCGGGGCGSGGCQGMPYDGQPIPDGGSAPPPPPGNGGGSPPPPPSAMIAPQTSIVTSTPVYRPTYTTANVTYRRGLFGRTR